MTLMDSIEKSVVNSAWNLRLSRVARVATRTETITSREGSSPHAVKRTKGGRARRRGSGARHRRLRFRACGRSDVASSSTRERRRRRPHAPIDEPPRRRQRSTRAPRRRRFARRPVPWPYRGQRRSASFQSRGLRSNDLAVREARSPRGRRCPCTVLRRQGRRDRRAGSSGARREASCFGVANDTRVLTSARKLAGARR